MREEGGRGQDGEEEAHERDDEEETVEKGGGEGRRGEAGGEREGFSSTVAEFWERSGPHRDTDRWKATEIRTFLIFLLKIWLFIK